MTPSLRGRTATIDSGVLPTIALASTPTPNARRVRVSMATTLGSEITIPLPRT